MQETWVCSWGQEDPLEKGLATHSNILTWNIPWREEPGELQSMGLQESDTTQRLKDHHQTLTRHWEKKVLWDVPPICGPEFGSALPTIKRQGSPGGSDDKESACSAGDQALRPNPIPGLRRSPREGNVQPLQYSCLENSMDRGACQATVHGVAKESDTTE